jgi:hypothetical protein
MNEFPVVCGAKTRAGHPCRRRPVPGRRRYPNHGRQTRLILSELVWAPMHVFPGVLLGLAIAFGGAHAPQAVGVLYWLGSPGALSDARPPPFIGVRSQPTGARIRRTQIFPAAHFPGRPHWTAGSLARPIV